MKALESHEQSMMMMDMREPTNESTDEQFIKMMISHHQSAVYMSEGFIQYGKAPKLISRAKKNDS